MKPTKEELITASKVMNYINSNYNIIYFSDVSSIIKELQK